MWLQFQKSVHGENAMISQKDARAYSNYDLYSGLLYFFLSQARNLYLQVVIFPPRSNKSHLTIKYWTTIEPIWNVAKRNDSQIGIALTRTRQPITWHLLISSCVRQVVNKSVSVRLTNHIVSYHFPFPLT